MPRREETDEEQSNNELSFLPLCITSYRSRDEAGKLVSHFYHKGDYYLCFSYGLYAGSCNELSAKVELPSYGPSIVDYIIVPKFKSFFMVDAVSFCHLLTFSDGSMKGLKFKHDKFVTIYDSSVAPNLAITSSPASYRLNAFLDGILYTCNKNVLSNSGLPTLDANIYSFDFKKRSVEPFYATNDEEIISFDFMSRECLVDDITYPGKRQVYFICLLKSEYSENMILEEHHHTGNHDNWTFDLGGHRRYNLLTVSDDEFCYMKVLGNDTVIVLTNSYTQTMKLGENGLKKMAFFNNKGLPKEENHQFLKNSYNIMYEKSAIFLTIFDVHANRYTAKIHSSLLNEGQVQKDLKWSKERIFKLSKHDLCDAVLQLSGKRYIALTRMSGINFISNTHRGPKIEKVKGAPLYANKVYLASQVVRNKGTDIDSLLLGGSFNSKRGFLERKFSAYDESLLKLTTSTKVPLDNVTDFWVADLMTDDGNNILYESRGSVYKNGILLTDEPYDYGILVTRTGMVLKSNMDGSTGEMKQIDMLQSDNSFTNAFCYPIKNSYVRIAILDPKSTHLRKTKDIFIEGLDSKNSIIDGCSNGIQRFLFAVYSCGKVSVWDTTQNEIATSGPDLSFIAYDLLIKNFCARENSGNNSIYVIASTYIGCVRVYKKSESSFLEIALEIHSSYGQKLEILGTLSNSPLVFLYNEKETILLNLNNLTYGFIQLGLVPKRMRIRPGKELFSLCVLDSEFRMNVFDFGITSGSGDLTQQIVSLKPQVGNQILHLSSVPVRLHTIPNNLNQAVVCLVDTNSGQYELMLFDYLLMKPISTFRFPNTKYLHAIVKPLWSEDDSIYSSLRYFYGDKFIVCLSRGDKRTEFSLFEIRDSEIVQLYAHCLEDRVYSVLIYYEKSMVLFSGDRGVVAYRVHPLKDGSEMLEACSFPVLELVDPIGLSAYIDGNYLVHFEPMKGFVRTHLSIKETTEYPSEDSGGACMSFLDFGSITQVATKRFSRKQIKPGNKYMKNGKICSLGRLSSLSSVELKYSNRSYVATIGFDNILAIYEDSDKSLVENDGLTMPYLKTRLPDEIISLTPIPDGFHNLQICSSLNEERLKGVLPLFMLCGTQGQVYIVSELVNDLWMGPLHYCETVGIKNGGVAPNSEASMRNATRQYTVNNETGINESGFDEMGKSLKRRHIDHLPHRTIGFFDPAKLKRVAADFL